MNTYAKYCPNVFCAKCTEEHQRGDTITMTTKHGKEHDAIVFNFLVAKDGFYYYSVVRADGFNVQQWAKRKAERIARYAANAEKRAQDYYNRSNRDRDFLSLGEPIKIGHHSENRHRRAIEDAHRNFGNYVRESDKAERLEERARGYEFQSNKINLSMPESLEYYADLLQQAKEKHQFLKDNPEARTHSYSLAYAAKNVKEQERNYEIAVKLWGEPGEK